MDKVKKRSDTMQDWREVNRIKYPFEVRILE